MMNESKLFLEAMLYLLDDPALDRVDFESRLADDVRLCEILAESVSIHQALQLQALQLIDVNRQPEIDLPALSSQRVVDATRASTASHSNSSTSNFTISHRFALSLATIAASLLLVSYIGWQALKSTNGLPFQIAKFENKRQASTVIASESAASNSEASELRSVLLAWGEVKDSDQSEFLIRFTNFSDLEYASSTHESTEDRDVPEWLVLAAAADLEGGAGADLRLDDIESRTLVQ